MLPSIPGYDSWKLASPYDDEHEWTETYGGLSCRELWEDDPSDEHKCGFECHPDQNVHECQFAGEIEVTCAGDPEGDFTFHWECPECGAEHQEEAA